MNHRPGRRRYGDPTQFPDSDLASPLPEKSGRGTKLSGSTNPSEVYKKGGNLGGTGLELSLPLSAVAPALIQAVALVGPKTPVVLLCDHDPFPFHGHLYKGEISQVAAYSCASPDVPRQPRRTFRAPVHHVDESK